MTATADIIGHHIVSMLRIVAELAGWLDDSGKVARRVRRTIVALLRPAESATRRLIIAASAGIRVEVRELPPRPERPRGPSWMALLAAARRRGAEATPTLRHQLCWYWIVLSLALRIVMIFRMVAAIATMGFFPLVMRRL